MLRYVNSTRAPQRAHEVLQELRDISSMAMEYFDEKIVPILKKRLPGADLSGRLMGSAPGNGHELERVRKAKGRTTTLMLYLSGGIRGGRLEEGRGGGQGTHRRIFTTLSDYVEKLPSPRDQIKA